METTIVYWGYYRDPCTQIIPTLGPKVCKYYLHGAIWIPRDTSRPQQCLLLGRDCVDRV